MLSDDVRNGGDGSYPELHRLLVRLRSIPPGSGLVVVDRKQRHSEAIRIAYGIRQVVDHHYRQYKLSWKVKRLISPRGLTPRGLIQELDRLKVELEKLQGHGMLRGLKEDELLKALEWFREAIVNINAVCPGATLWKDIYDELLEAWEKRGGFGDPPPGPMSNAAIAKTHDGMVRLQWESFLRWARGTGLSHLIPRLEREQMYIVSDLQVLRTGEYSYLYVSSSPRNTEPRRKPSEKEVQEALEALKESWSAIAGDLADATDPLEFTGRKRRRLVVYAERDVKPPWGTWTSLERRPGRGSFTRLRAAVNETIHPHEVDHIDFVHRR